MTTAPARKELPPAYEPATVEQRIYARWEEADYFQPRPGGEPYCLIMPPPNVTGELHLGHGLEDAISDALVRWHRMMGDTTLWLPGEDHAGIATQNVIERELAKEGLTRQDLGREAFVERTWMWVRKYRSRIADQHRKLGASADWTRDVFTLDPGIVKAVRTTFVSLYNDGLIYRGLRMINWCPRCETALSDLEVDYVEEQTKLYYVRYPIVGHGGMPLPDYVVVATTRPETMVADTGVAVNPADERYEDKIGLTLLLPIIGREIPVVADEAVKPEFGTGAVKVTPGHDPNDWEIGQRHDLPVIVAMDQQARMNDEAGPYAGMGDLEARAAILRDLEDEGFLDHAEDYTHSIGRCSRCGTAIQPIPSEQWWLDVRKEYAPGVSLAGAAAAAVREGRIRIVPQRFEKVYLNWMDNIRDWCISRQLWWGHQIPVWYCESGHTTVQVDDPAACPECGGSLRQDEDVLDTWFSSGLAPHADLGWPDDTEDLRTFYPTNDMQMGYDIMFFWCARMVMFGLYNMRERGPEGAVPFRTVLFHGLIRDANGEKMTKSRGNVVDPLEVAEKYGADAFRFGFLTGATLGGDQKYSDERLAAARNFANKLWNSTRFVLMQLGPRRVRRPHPADRATFPLEDRWILSRLERLTEDVDSLMRAYQLGEAARQVEEFLWSEFCDWYIEMAKPRLRAGDDRPLSVLAHVADYGLRLLHPFMPFVTEELWQALRDHLEVADLPPMLIVAWFPKSGANWRDPEAEDAMAHVIEVNRAIRNIRAEKKLEASARPRVYIRAGSLSQALRETLDATAFTSRVEPELLPTEAEVPAGEHAFARVGATEVAVALPGVDHSAERDRLSAELAEAERYMEGLERQLSNGQFLAKAPAHVVDSMRARLAEARARAEGLRERLSGL
jgi:valyl-tRNA synthetase